MSRDAILVSIRKALNADPADEERRRAVAARLKEPPDHLVPARARRPVPELKALFEDFLKQQGTECIALAGPAEIPEAIARYLRGHGLPLRVRTGSDPLLASLPWERVPDLVRKEGPAQDDDVAGLSRAIAGVAETGTLVLASGPDNPVTLAFVPETHLVVLRADRIVGGYEAIADLLAAELGPGAMPRTLNLITGASRTGDIGGRIVKGAHGPRRLTVFLLGSE
jgi:L-lactate dehydrogenase complex protein LldG